MSLVPNTVKELTSLSLGHCTLQDRFQALTLGGTSPSDCAWWKFSSRPKGINRSRFTSVCYFGIQQVKCCQSALMFKLSHKVNLINSLQQSDHRFFFCLRKNAHRHFWCTQTFVYFWCTQTSHVFDFANLNKKEIWCSCPSYMST